MLLLIASAVAPIHPPGILRDGGVLISGDRILAVGPADRLRREHPGVRELDLGQVLLTPGLVNAHTHLELTDTPRPPAGLPFGEWLLNLVRSRIALGPDLAPASAAAATRGAAESLAFGVTCVGDITRFAAATRPALASSPLRAVSYGEVQAMARRRDILPERLAEATDLSHDGWAGPSRLLVGVTPHAPYTIEPDGYAACLAFARNTGRPIATHLAETTEETAFLAEQTGPLRRLWDDIGDWSDDVPVFSGTPVAFAQSLGLLDHPTLLAHANYLDDADLALLTGSRASVVFCPRTHAYFGHPPHRFREMLALGVNVCLGTDSRASSPDLDLLADARHLRRAFADVPAELLWEMVTLRGARALGVADDLGSLAPGKWADLVAWPLPSPAAVLDEAAPPAQVWLAGQPTHSADPAGLAEGR